MKLEKGNAPFAGLIPSHIEVEVLHEVHMEDWAGRTAVGGTDFRKVDCSCQTAVGAGSTRMGRFAVADKPGYSCIGYSGSQRSSVRQPRSSSFCVEPS